MLRATIDTRTIHVARITVLSFIPIVSGRGLDTAILYSYVCMLYATYMIVSPLEATADTIGVHMILYDYTV